MTLKETVGRLLGDDSRATDEATDARQRQPSHVCQSCGEEYYTDPELQIDSCRNCGGIKVESV